MSFGPKMIGDRTKGREEALCMAGGFETPHGSLSLPGSLVRTFRTIVQALVLAVLNTGHDFPLCSSVTGQLVGNDDPRYVLQAFEQRGAKNFLAACLLRRLCDPYIQHIAILINRPPQVVDLPVDFEKDARPACHLSPNLPRRFFNALAYVCPNFRHHCRIVSWVTITPRSAIISSISRKLREKRK